MLTRMIFTMGLLFISNVSLADESRKECAQPEYRCDCGPNVPFEGWIMYMVETCGKKEQWIPMEFRGQNYDDRATCYKAIEATLDCPNSK